MTIYQLTTGLIVSSDNDITFSDKGNGVIIEGKIVVPTIHPTFSYSEKVRNFSFNISNVVAVWNDN